MKFKDKKKQKKWKRVVDNAMRWYGDLDEEKKIIRVNKSKKKNKKKGEIINTIVHEEMHKMHPQMHEKTVSKKTKKKIKKMGNRIKRKMYNLYK